MLRNKTVSTIKNCNFRNETDINFYALLKLYARDG